LKKSLPILERIVWKDSIASVSAHIGHTAITEIPCPRIESGKFVGEGIEGYEVGKKVVVARHWSVQKMLKEIVWVVPRMIKGFSFPPR
jgi:hypothetical protein